MKKVLVLGSHTDDESIGCGGTISKMKEQGDEIYVMGFSPCDKTELTDEFFNAIGALNVKGKIFTFNFRTFTQNRQEILQELIDFGKIFEPDIILTHSTHDIHQDHKVISEESIRAFKHSTILGYELPWNNIESKHQCTVKLTKQHIDKKIEAISMYKSQAHRSCLQPDIIHSWARMRGVHNGCDYAEVFEVIKLRL
jgi:LmbE family N-acetylglucosaminyl deacetylase